MKILTWTFCAISAALVQHSTAAPLIFEDFNINEGIFASDPNTSGSSANDAASSVADRITIDGPLEGIGHQRLQLDWEDTVDAGTDLRIRHLANGGNIPGNILFNTTSGEDGWIGFFLKTTTPGWTVQLTIEGPEINSGTPKSVIADGLWHAYEWNLDVQTGGADGWGAAAGIFGGDADVENGTYSIDSIIFRDGSTASSTIYMDFVAKSDSGSIAALVPEPTAVLMGLLGALTLASRRRRGE